MTHTDFADKLRARRQRRDLGYGATFAISAIMAVVSALCDLPLREPRLQPLLFCAATSLMLVACFRLFEGRAAFKTGKRSHSGVQALVTLWIAIYLILAFSLGVAVLLSMLPSPLWSPS